MNRYNPHLLSLSIAALYGINNFDYGAIQGRPHQIIIQPPKGESKFDQERLKAAEAKRKRKNKLS